MVVLFASKVHIVDSMSTEKNWNNYAENNNFIDISDTYVAQLTTLLWSSEITMRNKDGVEKVIKDASAGFQIREDSLYYRTDSDLYCFNFITEENTLVKEGVIKFCIQNNVLYAKIADATGQALLRKDLTSGNETKITEKVYRFWIQEDVLYVVPNELEKELHIYNLDGTKQKIISYPIPDLANHTLYLWNEKTADFCWPTLEMVDLSTSYLSRKRLFQNYEGPSPHTVIAASEEHFFISFQTLKYDGSFVSDVDDPQNGLWYIESETYEQRKISDLVFDSLFMTDDYLFGTIGNDLYAVDLETFEVQEAN